MKRKRVPQQKNCVKGTLVKIFNLDEFIEYINYTRNMGFEQDPDYEYLRGLFRQVMSSNNLICDNDFDWLIKAYGAGSMVINNYQLNILTFKLYIFDIYNIFRTLNLLKLPILVIQ